MEPVTITLAACTVASIIVAGISSERARIWKQKALTASRFHTDAVFAERRALDETKRLKGLLDDVEHRMFIDRETFERKQVATYAELTEVRAKLAERIQRASNAGRKARQAQLAMQAAKRAETLKALQDCVEARV